MFCTMMTQEELKTEILSDTTMDPISKKMLLKFLEVTTGVTDENISCLYQQWESSDDGKMAFISLMKETWQDKDNQIQCGLTAIERGDYIVFENTLRLGTYVVRNQETRLLGLVTTNHEEIMPCIFDELNVHLDWLIETRFKGRPFTLQFVKNRESLPTIHYDFVFGEKGAYFLEARPKFDIETKQRIHDPKGDYIEQQLIDLLNQKHEYK